MVDPGGAYIVKMDCWREVVVMGWTPVLGQPIKHDCALIAPRLCGVSDFFGVPVVTALPVEAGESRG